MSGQTKVIRSLRAKYEFEHQLVLVKETEECQIHMLTEFPPSNMVKQLGVLNKLLATERPPTEAALVEYNMRDRDINAAVLVHEDPSLESLAPDHQQRDTIHRYATNQMELLAKIINLNMRISFVWTQVLHSRTLNEEHIMRIPLPGRVVAVSLLEGDERTVLTLDGHTTAIDKNVTWFSKPTTAKHCTVISIRGIVMSATILVVGFA